MPLKDPKIIIYGDHGLLVQFQCEGFSEPVSRFVQNLAARLRTTGLWREVIAGYDSLLVSYDPCQNTIDNTVQTLKDAITNSPKHAEEYSGKIIEIPVCYGGLYGPDMAAIEKSSGLTEQKIITLHAEQDYLVCMMGFIPGFCFLSEAPKALHHKRHATPRQHVSAGSVGIAGWQTGIYGLDSPGGWQIIGRTPSVLFDKNRETPFLIQAGDRVKFIPSGPEIFEAPTL